MCEYPLVSVVIPTFGRSELLPRAIDSVMTQTYRNIEVFVVDDNDYGSEHRMRTEKIQKDYLGCSNITFLMHKENLGGAAARNTGSKASKGKYIAFLDDDDEWFPEKIEKQVRYFELMGNDVGAIYCGYILQEHEGDVEIFRTENGKVIKEILMLEFDPGASSTLVFRRDVLKELNYFDERFIRYQDLEILIRLCRNYEVDVCPGILLRINGHNVPNSKVIESAQKLFLREFKNDIMSLPFQDSSYIYAIHYIQLANLFLGEKMLLGFLIYYMKSIFLFPKIVFRNKVNKRIREVLRKKLNSALGG